MSLMRITTPTMVLVSSAWIDPRRTRPILEGFTRGRGLLVHIESAHQGLLDVQSFGSALDAQIAELTQRLQSGNGRFNVFTRAIYNVLTSAAELCEDAVLAARCTTARDAIFPRGTQIVQWSYTDKAGEVELFGARRTPEVDETLKCVILPDRATVFDRVEDWVATGRSLGENESLRRELERKREAKSGAVVTPGDVQAARRQWARVARALLDDVALEKLDADTAQQLTGDLLYALEQSNARRAVTDEDATVDEQTESDETAPDANAPVKTDAAPVVLNPREAPANDAAPAPARKVG